MIEDHAVIEPADRCRRNARCRRPARPPPRDRRPRDPCPVATASPSSARAGSRRTGARPCPARATRVCRQCDARHCRGRVGGQHARPGAASRPRRRADRARRVASEQEPRGADGVGRSRADRRSPHVDEPGVQPPTRCARAASATASFCVTVSIVVGSVACSAATCAASATADRTTGPGDFHAQLVVGLASPPASAIRVRRYARHAERPGLVAHVGPGEPAADEAERRPERDEREHARCRRQRESIDERVAWRSHRRRCAAPSTTRALRASPRQTLQHAGERGRDDRECGRSRQADHSVATRGCSRSSRNRSAASTTTTARIASSAAAVQPPTRIARNVPPIRSSPPSSTTTSSTPASRAARGSSGSSRARRERRVRARPRPMPAGSRIDTVEQRRIGAERLLQPRRGFRRAVRARRARPPASDRARPRAFARRRIESTPSPRYTTRLASPRGCRSSARCRRPRAPRRRRRTTRP